MIRKKKTEALSMRISKELKIALENEAIKEGISVSNATTRILKTKLKEWGHPLN